MRVLVTGMGGELGTRVAQILEADPKVTDILGVDFVPPRRRLQRAEFTRIDPLNAERQEKVIAEFAPQWVVHFGVYEPHSRMAPQEADARTRHSTVSSLRAAAKGGALERVVVRSGLEIYGRGGARARVPDESVPVAPSSLYGRMCRRVESVATAIGRRHEVPVAAIRMAPVLGSHVPSPLGRILRLPAVPIPAFADPPFSLCAPEDACQAMVRAVQRGLDGPINVVGPGAASPWQIVRFGNRIPIPVVGPLWALAARGTEVVGAPMPDHVSELLSAGRTGDTGRIGELGMDSLTPTQVIAHDVYEWAEVVTIKPTSLAVAR
ncbi:MAG: NAD-dependent epimerase/dehydratase family protein [Acidimicrobiia bacterium]